MATQIQRKPDMGIFPGEDGRPIPNQAIVRNPPTINPPTFPGQPGYIGIPPGETGPGQKPITRTGTPGDTNMPGIINANPVPTSGAVETTPVTPTTWNVTDPQTVQGQIKGIIAQDSPLMQLAETSGKQQAAQRGLINSSMAVGAAQDAVIKNALPIAAQDAQTQAAAAQTNTTEANKMGMFGAEIGSKDQQFNISEQNKLLMQNLDNENKVKLADINTSYQTLVEQNKGAAQLYDTYQKAINVILTNPDLSPESKQIAIDTQIGMLQAGMAMYSDVVGLNLDAILNFDEGNAPTNGEATPISQVGNQGNEQIADLATRQSEWDAKKAEAEKLKPDPNIANYGRGPAGRKAFEAAKAAYEKAIADLGSRPA